MKRKSAGAGRNAAGKGEALSVSAVERIVRECGFAPETGQVEQLAEYLSLVLKWNKVMNLIGPYSWEEALRTLIMDSLHLARFLESLSLPESPSCWDFGAGAGLPGIPLRVVWGKGTYHLVEVREKRALFMQQTVARLKLPNTHVFRGRAEDFMAEQEPADILLSRAFMPWEKLLDFAGSNVAPTGRVIILAIEDVPATLPEGWRLEARHEYAVGADTRYFWALAPIIASS
ncbi:16S rRNA (guanine(527)-N(7))-methyltransferase RsmG [Desulfovibrio mangrovi]|uniref:16S rRNA (guanine(527)-N(7))-methyltransferase RsmG n=1 Tax=Desulfovibrio mangrovi TaxID=2976983 RepID=UPI0022475E69|nr:16S rRNA (guanine(527)-N(7))-methyltransferase RsmG [Desulfovibrio mangrovi]UZP67805.1 16S rRNA (guanine(527)-N(7))-methyltransferase RsmG [Desulfovibrio mangrovi]